MILVVDDWYADTDWVRARALTERFDTCGNFPGARTRVGLPWDQRRNIEDLGFSITHWPDAYNGKFQLVLSGERTWLHHDETEWAAVVYLIPDRIWEREEQGSGGERHGTALYRRKPSAQRPREMFAHPDLDARCSEHEDWEEHVFVRGLYGRLLIYDARYYHRSGLAGFGTDLANGRLTQTFFWNGGWSPK